MENKNQKTSKSSFRDKLEIFLNTMLYCFWKKERNSMEKAMDAFMHIYRKMIEWLCPKKYKVRLYRKILRNQWESKLYCRNIRSGLYIGIAKIQLRIFEFSYLVLLLGIIAGVTLGLFDSIFNEQTFTLFAIGLSIVLANVVYGPLDKMVFRKDRYIKYFKKFEKKDDEWLKKWKRISLLFKILGCVVGLLGFFCVAGIAILISKLRNG